MCKVKAGSFNYHDMIEVQKESTCLEHRMCKVKPGSFNYHDMIEVQKESTCLEL